MLDRAANQTLIHCLVQTGSTQEDPSQHDWKIVEGDVKNQNKQRRRTTSALCFWFRSLRISSDKAGDFAK